MKFSGSCVQVRFPADPNVGIGSFVLSFSYGHTIPKLGSSSASPCICSLVIISPEVHGQMKPHSKNIKTFPNSSCFHLFSYELLELEKWTTHFERVNLKDSFMSSVQQGSQSDGKYLTKCKQHWAKFIDQTTSKEGKICLMPLKVLFLLYTI